MKGMTAHVSSSTYASSSIWVRGPKGYRSSAALSTRSGRATGRQYNRRHYWSQSRVESRVNPQSQTRDKACDAETPGLAHSVRRRVPPPSASDSPDPVSNDTAPRRCSAPAIRFRPWPSRSSSATSWPRWTSGSYQGGARWQWLGVDNGERSWRRARPLVTLVAPKDGGPARGRAPDCLGARTS